jgi:AraC-like DNA-binding protein
MDDLDLVLTGLRLEPIALHQPTASPRPDEAGKLAVNVWVMCAFAALRLAIDDSRMLGLQRGDSLVLHAESAGQRSAGSSREVLRCPLPQLPEDFTGIALSGQLTLAGRLEHPLLAALPALTLVRRGAPCIAECNSFVSDLIEAAACTGATDSTMFGRLFEILLIQVLRQKVSAGIAPTGFSRAVQDPGLGRAIAAIHHNPGYNWSLERLAAAGGLSRSAFSRRFTAITGTPAMKYLTSCRMHIAMRQIRDGQDDMEHIARVIGYRSPAAFQKAFKRVHGLTPAQAVGA